MIDVKPGPENDHSGYDDRSTVDLAHEALLTHWDLMREWVADPNIRLQREAEDLLEKAARRWRDEGQPRRPGLPDARTLKRYFKANAPSVLAKEYRKALEQEQRDQLRTRRYVQRTAIAVALLWSALWLWTNQYQQPWTRGLHALQVRAGLLAGPKLPEMVDIPSGKFLMGSNKDKDEGAEDDELPEHEVTVRRKFKLGKYEVTFDEYAEFGRSTGNNLPSDFGFGRKRR